MRASRKREKQTTRAECVGKGAGRRRDPERAAERSCDPKEAERRPGAGGGASRARGAGRGGHVTGSGRAPARRKQAGRAGRGGSRPSVPRAAAPRSPGAPLAWRRGLPPPRRRGADSPGAAGGRRGREAGGEEKGPARPPALPSFAGGSWEPLVLFGCAQGLNSWLPGSRRALYHWSHPSTRSERSLVDAPAPAASGLQSSGLRPPRSPDCTGINTVYNQNPTTTRERKQAVRLCLACPWKHDICTSSFSTTVMKCLRLHNL